MDNFRCVIVHKSQVSNTSQVSNASITCEKSIQTSLPPKFSAALTSSSCNNNTTMRPSAKTDGGYKTSFGVHCDKSTQVSSPALFKDIFPREVFFNTNCIGIKDIDLRPILNNYVHKIGVSNSYTTVIAQAKHNISHLFNSEEQINTLACCAID